VPAILAAIMENYIKRCGKTLGFSDVRITDIDLTSTEAYLQEWLQKGFHGDMDYMAKHGTKRTRPAELIPGTKSAIVCSINYLPRCETETKVSRYALGRDYHKLIRKRLQKLVNKLATEYGEFEWRCFADSAPVMEKALAVKAGIGWQGKNSLILTKQGSWFFLGVIYTSLELKPDQPHQSYCGKCTKCIDVCPTKAIIAPHQVNASRCISYLTIEHKGSIPLELRPLIGTHMYGCDECQLCCPWNRKAEITAEADFQPRNGLDSAKLIDLFAWSETDFLEKFQGSAIRRIGHERWLRNIAVALGNSKSTPEIVTALEARLEHPSTLVQEHVQWALQQHSR